MSRSAGPLLLAMAVLLVVPTSAPALRPIPDTSRAVHVWDDQLPDSMSAAQIAFVARRVDGTQKVSVSTARRLRAVKPGFLVLHYRLGIGDGPVPFRIGSRWASDLSFVRQHDSWFWHIGGRRVLQRQWDWWLMNPDSGWRSYWASRVLYEARLLGDDGVRTRSRCRSTSGRTRSHRRFGTSSARVRGRSVWSASCGTSGVVRPIGGGAVPADGRPRGWRLGLRSVSGSVTVPAHGGVVLLR